MPDQMDERRMLQCLVYRQGGLKPLDGRTRLAVVVDRACPGIFDEPFFMPVDHAKADVA